MGSLSNLYISQSYQSLIHFGNDTSASTTLTNIQDGVGNGLGVSFNTLGDLDVQRQLIVHSCAEITGAVDINTTFSGSTQGFVNQSSVNTQIQITGSYTPTGNQASITEIGIGWLVNGGAVSNGRVINVSGTPNSNVTYTIDQPYTANNVTYTFTGSIQREVEIEGDLNVSDDLFVGGHLIIEDGVEITGSIDITGDVTASNAWIQGDLVVSGTINAYEIITTIESASVIFSSGSNILGDSILDIQTLNGDVIMSGSSSLTGSMGITGNLNVLGNISSSTISGIGNVTTYSASVQSLINSVSSSISGTITTLSQSIDARLDYLEGPFSTSVDFRLDELENWSSSLQTNFATTAELTQTASFLQNQINQKLNSSSFNVYTSSTNISISALNAFTASTNVTTGSNTFTGRQTYSSSVVGGVIDLSVVGNTASFDCNLGNFFTLTLPTTPVNINPSNIQRGQTITLRITQNSTPTNVTYPTSIKFPFNSSYIATPVSGAIDILTFVSYDTSSLFGVATNRLT
jgi:hypothetical protein